MTKTPKDPSIIKELTSCLLTMKRAPSLIARSPLILDPCPDVHYRTYTHTYTWTYTHPCPQVIRHVLSSTSGSPPEPARL